MIGWHENATRTAADTAFFIKRSGYKKTRGMLAVFFMQKRKKDVKSKEKIIPERILAPGFISDNDCRKGYSLSDNKNIATHFCELRYSLGPLPLVRPPGLEPGWSPTRPSNVRVCQFRHGRKCFLHALYYNILMGKVNDYLWEERKNAPSSMMRRGLIFMQYFFENTQKEARI